MSQSEYDYFDVNEDEVLCPNCDDEGCDYCGPADDGQPTEYEEWQDYMGGDDYDFGQFDHYDEY